MFKYLSIAALTLGLGACMVNETDQATTNPQNSARDKISAVKIDSAKSQSAQSNLSTLEKFLIENSDPLCQKAAIGLESGLVDKQTAWDACASTWTKILAFDTSVNCVNAYKTAVMAYDPKQPQLLLSQVSNIENSCSGDGAALVDPFDPNQSTDPGQCYYLEQKQQIELNNCGNNKDCSTNIASSFAQMAANSGCAYGSSGVVDPTTGTGMACTREYVPMCGYLLPQIDPVQCPDGAECAQILSMPAPYYQTFGNKCELEKSGFQFAYEGICKGDTVQTDSTQNTGICPEIYAPVCASIDPCANIDPKSGMACLAMAQMKTFGNECEAKNAGATSWTVGECKF